MEEKSYIHFDADYLPCNLVNQEADRQRGWKYDSRRGVYGDEDGCLMADEFGQDLG